MECVDRNLVAQPNDSYRSERLVRLQDLWIFYRSVQDCAVVCPPGAWWLPKGDASDRLIWIWDLLTFCFDFIHAYSGMHLLVLFPVDETYILLLASFIQKQREQFLYGRFKLYIACLFNLNIFLSFHGYQNRCWTHMHLQDSQICKSFKALCQSNLDLWFLLVMMFMPMQLYIKQFLVNKQ